MLLQRAVQAGYIGCRQRPGHKAIGYAADCQEQDKGEQEDSQCQAAFNFLYQCGIPPLESL